MGAKRYAQVQQKKCVSCGTCTKECPRDAVKVFHGCYALVDTERCIGCRKCAKVCPVDCILILERGEQG